MEIKHRENNIFFNVIRNETSLTEVFCNLMQYKAFRDLFLNFVNNKTKNLNLNFDDIKYEYFDTEKDFNIQEDDIDKKVGRGDLILSMDDLDYIFEIKIENTTKTTKNQPDGYLKYLKEQNDDNYKKRLFFIIPKEYKHKDNLQKVENNILYWEDFLHELKKSELGSINTIIKEFSNILDYRWFYYEMINFIFKELELILTLKKNKGYKLLEDMNMPQAMKKLFKVVDEVAKKFDTITSKVYVEKSPDHYGYALKNKENNIPEEWEFWFGVDFEIWAERNVPISIQVYSENQDEMKKIKDCLNLEYYSFSEEYSTLYFALDNSIFQSENTAKEIIDQIDILLEKIQN